MRWQSSRIWRGSWRRHRCHLALSSTGLRARRQPPQPWIPQSRASCAPPMGPSRHLSHALVTHLSHALVSRRACACVCVLRAAPYQVYNHHMANEMLSLQQQVRHDTWELLHDMSNLERQLESAKAMQMVQAATGTDNGGVQVEPSADGDGTSGADANANGGPPRSTAPMSRLERMSMLHAKLARERGEVAAASRLLHQEHSFLEVNLKRAAAELSSIRGAEAVRAASSDDRQRELQHVAHDLEQKIGAIRTAARIGLDSSNDSAAAKSKELAELEAIVSAAAEDVDRIEHRLLLPSNEELSSADLRSVHVALTSRLRALESQVRNLPTSPHISHLLSFSHLLTRRVYAPSSRSRLSGYWTRRRDEKTPPCRRWPSSSYPR